MTMSRRELMAATGGLAVMNVGLVSGRVAAAGIPEAQIQNSPLMQPPLMHGVLQLD